MPTSSPYASRFARIASTLSFSVGKSSESFKSVEDKLSRYLDKRDGILGMKISSTRFLAGSEPYNSS